MGNLFGKSKAKQFQDSQVTDQDRAILQIKQQRDKVKQYQKRLLTQLETEKEIIKKLVHSNQKNRALLLLKKKKFTEKILDKTDAELMNIENLITDIEFKNVEQNVLKGIQIGNEALKQLNAVFSIDQIEAILDETQEAVEKQQEISDLLSGYKETEDEAELDNELDMILGIEKETETKVGKDIARDLPEVPQSEPGDEIKGKEKSQISKKKGQNKVVVQAQ